MRPANQSRPTREVFAALCKRHTRRELAEIFDVTLASIDSWGSTFGCRPERQESRARPRVFGAEHLGHLPMPATPGRLRCRLVQRGYA